MSKTITVVGLLVSTNGVTLFKADGTSEIYAQSGYRTAEMAEKVAIGLAKNGGRYDLEVENFTLEDAMNKALGGVAVVEKVAGKTQIKDGKTGTVIVKDAAKLEQHMERAAFGKQAKGFKKFLADFKKIRSSHTVDDLLDFMSRNDLPIADDGSILVFKFLDKRDGHYVDHHTKTVKQNEGSLVHMPREAVDPSRRHLCSAGLHVCSRHYGSYGGSVFLAKVKPSDVVAVPERENGKMRVAAYHLVKLLPTGIYSRVAGRMSMLYNEGSAVDEEAVKILSDVIAGNHVKIKERVRVGGSTALDKSTPIETTAVKQKAEPAKSKSKKVEMVAITPNVKVNPKALRDAVKAATSGDMSAAINAAIKGPKVKKSTLLAQAVERAETRKTPKQDVVKAPKLTKSKKPLLERLDPTWTDEYLAKLSDAYWLWKDGKSLREVAKTVGIDRESMSKNLKRFD